MSNSIFTVPVVPNLNRPDPCHREYVELLAVKSAFHQGLQAPESELGMAMAPAVAAVPAAAKWTAATQGPDGAELWFAA